MPEGGRGRRRVERSPGGWGGAGGRGGGERGVTWAVVRLATFGYKVRRASKAETQKTLEHRLGPRKALSKRAASSVSMASLAFSTSLWCSEGSALGEPPDLSLQPLRETHPGL